MKIVDTLQDLGEGLDRLRQTAAASALDTPLPVSRGRRVSSVGELHLYALTLPSNTPNVPIEDAPVTVLQPGMEPTEGYVVGKEDDTLLVQTFDAIGDAVTSATVVPDVTGFLNTAMTRLLEVASKADSYVLGPAERLVPWLTRDQGQAAAASAVLGTLWSEEFVTRRARVATTAVELARTNKRVLIVCPDHEAADHLTGVTARTLKAAAMPFKSVLSRYEMAIRQHTAGMPLVELGFEAQMHQFYAKSRADKAALRRKYERFRELTPLLSYKAEKQRDLDEVKLLEWRLLTQISDLQGKIKDIDATLAEYEALPIWKRLALQTFGKNIESFPEYRAIYEQNIQGLMAEVEVAQERIAELKPEAAIPKDVRPEYQELKEEMTRLGGTRKVRELLAAEEGTNRQAFVQNKRIVVTTGGRIISDPLFRRVRFDILIADETPWIPAPYLMAAAVLAREKIVLSGDTRDLPDAELWASPLARKTREYPDLTAAGPGT